MLPDKPQMFKIQVRAKGKLKRGKLSALTICSFISTGDKLPGLANINSLPNIPIYYIQICYIQILTLDLLWINIGSKFNDSNVLKYLGKKAK